MIGKIIFVGVFLLLIGFIIYVVNGFGDELICLKEIARDYCNKNYDGVGEVENEQFVGAKWFTCLENVREETTKLFFTEAEQEGCRK